LNGTTANKQDAPRVGISGWRYEGWRGKFYPEGLTQHRELEYASRVFNSIEINGSFYSLQLPSSYQRWYAQTPQNFLFSVKGARYITHMKRLRDVKIPLANFFASGLLGLRDKQAQFSGNSRHNFVGTEKSSPNSCSCFHAIPQPQLRSQKNITTKSKLVHFSKLMPIVNCGTPWKSGIRVL